MEKPSPQMNRTFIEITEWYLEGKMQVNNTAAHKLQ